MAEERKEKVKEREYNLLQTLMDNIPDSIYFKDEKNRFIRVNKAKTERSNTTPQEMLGKTDFDFFSKERAEKSFADDNRVIESNKPLINKIEKVTLSNGREGWVSVTKMPRCDEEGKVIGTMGISRDITETKRLMETLKSLGTADLSDLAVKTEMRKEEVKRIMNNLTETGYVKLFIKNNRTYYKVSMGSAISSI